MFWEYGCVHIISIDFGCLTKVDLMFLDREIDFWVALERDWKEEISLMFEKVFLELS